MSTQAGVACPRRRQPPRKGASATSAQQQASASYSMLRRCCRARHGGGGGNNSSVSNASADDSYNTAAANGRTAVPDDGLVATSPLELRHVDDGRRCDLTWDGHETPLTTLTRDTRRTDTRTTRAEKTEKEEGGKIDRSWNRDTRWRIRTRRQRPTSRLARTLLSPLPLSLPLPLILACWCVFLSALPTGSAECAVGIKTPGKTWPQGDIVLEHGKSLRILCVLNETFVGAQFPGKNASDLVFFRNEKQMEKEYITIVNETTIELFIEKPPPSEDFYYCYLRLNNNKFHSNNSGNGNTSISTSNGNNKQYESVCLNKVVVGFKPKMPEDFDCVSENWQMLTCRWTPINHYVTTKFSLAFKLPGIIGRRYPCPLQSKHLLDQNMCFWNTSTDPFYRQPYEFYNFVLHAENVLGNDTFYYKFHNFGNVVPAKPEKLTVVNKTFDSALLYWCLPFPMQTFPPGVHHKIEYQNQWDLENAWKTINITDNVHDRERYYNLTGLEYANVVYDVRVYLKSAAATNPARWSDFSDVTFRTPPKLPSFPPRTTTGSFEIVENNGNRDVYLYWQTIHPKYENGDNFRYVVSSVEENGRRLNLLPNETTKTYAKFKALSFNSYRFKIVSANIVGANKDSATIFVPSRHDIPPEPIAFTKIAFDGGLYELSWKPSVTSKKIMSYTIFWCDNDRDRPYQCMGYFDWVHVPSNITMYNMTVPDEKKVYQFAIAANTETASSGIVWASCTVIHNKVVGKMKSAWINRIGSDFIEVGWKLECSDRIGIVEGFNIYYCPIVSPYNLNCKEPKLNVTIKADPQTIHGIVRGLKPYTTYMLAVAVLTKNGEGLHSDPLYNTTLEAAPSTPPRNIAVTNVTNSTMLISWEEPEAMNGVLRYYEIYYNDKSIKVEEANEVELKDLLAHTNYSIRLTACTVSCSVKSNTIYALTDIGWPGEIELPNVHFVNSSQVEVSWKKPDYPAGHLNYYQIMNTNGEIQNSTSNEAQLPIPDCQTVGREAIYQFRVRAVNIARDQTHLPGPWSIAGEGNCYGGGPSYQVLVIIWLLCSVSVFVFIVGFAFLSKRAWIKCNAMRDVEVKLPPGLTPSTTLLEKPGDQHARQSSTDSSGCSSGQESVTSSLTSESHVSSDSGADVDPISTSNKLLEATPAWEASNLRQRNVGAVKPSGADTACWEPYVKVAKIGENTLQDRLSLTRSSPNLTDNAAYLTSPQNWTSTETSVYPPMGYMSMSSSEDVPGIPNPIPKEGYSIVGIVSKPLRPKSENVNKLMIASATPQSTQDIKTPYSYVGSNPEQKTLGLGDLNFSKPFSSNDKITTPYVQAALVDSFKTSGATTFLTESSKKPFVTAFSGTQLSPDASSKQYVTASTIPDIVKSSVKAELLEVKSKPYVPKQSVFQMLQQQQQKPEKSEAINREDTEPLYWASTNSEDSSSGNSSIQDESTEKKETSTLEEPLKSGSQFTQNPRFGKTISLADEQYSKVTVVTSSVQ